MNDIDKSTPRERRRELRREQILEAARFLLETDGPDGLTIARLAEALDYTVGAVYRYFPGKGAILAEVELRLVAEITGTLTAALEEVGTRVEKSRLNQRRRSLVAPLRLATAYASLPRSHSRAFAVLSVGLARDGSLVSAEDDARVMRNLQPLLDRVAAILETGRETGALSPGEGPRRAIQLWATIHGAVQLRQLEPVDPRFAPEAELALDLTENLLRGFGAPPRALEAARRFLDRMGDES